MKISAAVDAWFVSPEDLILKKPQFYQEGGSEKHLRDIAAMLRASAGDIALDYISQWVAELRLAGIWQRLAIES